jgi:hypothetical protein
MHPYWDSSTAPNLSITDSQQLSIINRDRDASSYVRPHTLPHIVSSAPHIHSSYFATLSMSCPSLRLCHLINSVYQCGLAEN